VEQTQVKKSAKNNWIPNAIVYALLAYSTLVIFGKFPNPAERYFEISPGSYRLLSDAYSDGTPQYKQAIDAALKDDGKITMAKYHDIFRLWTQTIKVPYSIDTSDNLSLEQERSRLLSLSNTTIK
jgi:hypothetical protein